MYNDAACGVVIISVFMFSFVFTLVGRPSAVIAKTLRKGRVRNACSLCDIAYLNVYIT